MASNFWNWKPTPIDLKLKDGRSRAAAEQMAGYRPFEADPSHFEATPQILAQEQMQGYTPALESPVPEKPYNYPSTMPTSRAPSQYDNAGTGMAYTRKQEDELKAEYERNNARIAEIEQELKSIATSDRKAIDDLDLALAQNRADIGDLGNAQMHLNRIDQRRAVELGKAGNTNADRVAAEDEIDRLYMMRAEGSPGQQAYYDRAIARKEAEYARKYGKPYGGELAIPTGPQSAGTVSNFQGYDDVLQQELKANGNNGRLSKAQIAKLNAILDNLPAGDERNARKKALDAVVSNEKHSENVAKQKAKENAAIDEAEGAVDTWDWKVNDSQTYTAKNNLAVTVKRLSGGKTQFVCGKTVRTR